MNLMCQIIHNRGEYKQVIPNDSPLVFRLGFQGVRTALRYIRFKRLIEKCDEDNSFDVKNSAERYRESKFSCLYGRQGRSLLRKITHKAESRKIANRYELQSLIQHGNLREKGGKVGVKFSRLWLLFAIFYLLLCFASLGSIAILIIFSYADFLNKVLGAGLYIAVFSVCCYAMHDCIFKPYFIAKKLGSQLEMLIGAERNKTKIFVIS